MDTEAVRDHLTAIRDASTQHELTAGIFTALADTAVLSTEVDRLYGLLRDERMRYANLVAAIRAALGAAYDGEPDPLAYLREEIPAECYGGEGCR